MTGPEHYWRAEKFAEEAYKHIGQDDERDIAGAWSALAQVHATLALAAATALNGQSAEEESWHAAAGTRSDVPAPLKRPGRPRFKGSGQGSRPSVYRGRGGGSSRQTSED
jgi:hypothetical protein